MKNEIKKMIWIFTGLALLLLYIFTWTPSEASAQSPIWIYDLSDESTYTAYDDTVTDFSIFTPAEELSISDSGIEFETNENATSDTSYSIPSSGSFYFYWNDVTFSEGENFFFRLGTATNGFSAKIYKSGSFHRFQGYTDSGIHIQYDGTPFTHSYALNFAASSTGLYYDGTIMKSQSSPAPPYTSTSYTYFNSINGGSSGPTGTLKCAAFFDEVLSPEDISALDTACENGTFIADIEWPTDESDYSIFGQALTPEFSVTNNDFYWKTNTLYPRETAQLISWNGTDIEPGCAEYVIVEEPESGVAEFDGVEYFFQYAKHLTGNTTPDNSIDLYTKCFPTETAPDYTPSTSESWNDDTSGDMEGTEYLDNITSSYAESCSVGEDLHMIVASRYCEDLTAEEKTQVRIRFASANGNNNQVIPVLVNPEEPGCPFDSITLCAGYTVIKTGVSTIYDTSYSLLNTALSGIPDLIFFWNRIEIGEEICATIETETLCNTPTHRSENGLLDIIIRAGLLFWLASLYFTIIRKPNE
jgi:hypothetical protein